MISGQIFVVLNQQTSQRLLAEAIAGINLRPRRPVSARRPWGGNKTSGWDAVRPERQQLHTRGWWRWGELGFLSTQQDWPHRYLYFRNTLSEDTKVTLCSDGSFSVSGPNKHWFPPVVLLFSHSFLSDPPALYFSLFLPPHLLFLDLSPLSGRRWFSASGPFLLLFIYFPSSYVPVSLSDLFNVSYPAARLFFSPTIYLIVLIDHQSDSVCLSYYRVFVSGFCLLSEYFDILWTDFMMCVVKFRQFRENKAAENKKLFLRKVVE